MRVLSLFSGGGLGDYGLELAGMEIVGQIEIDDYCHKILQLRWPDVPKWRDIREVKGEEVIARVGQVDLIAGGFPCQPFSVAGKRRGKEDDRYLWPEMCQVIAEVRPAWVLGENVPGIIRSGLDQVLSDLEAIGYATRTFTVPACAVDAPHRRDRVWIVGYAERFRLEHRGNLTPENHKGKVSTQGTSEDVADSKRIQLQGSWAKGLSITETPRGAKGVGWNGGIGKLWAVEPPVGRVAHGVANRVDRLKLLGNGQVVPLVEWIGRRILEANAAKLRQEVGG